MALSGKISAEQLTTFVLYVEFVTAASLSVCDQWGEQRPFLKWSFAVMLSRPHSGRHAFSSLCWALWLHSAPV